MGTDAVWSRSDALVAAAISWSRDGALGLVDVLATVDWIDRALPLHAELVTAVGRLVAAGLLEVDGATLRLTPAGRTLTDVPTKVQQRRLDTILVRLHDLPTPDAVWELDEAAYRAAVAEYQQR